MKVCLALHDFSVVHNRLDILLKLKEHFPNFKVSLFTIPIDKKMDWGPYLIRGELLEKIREHLGWMQIITHGLRHEGSDVKNWNYKYTKDIVLPTIKTIFCNSLPFVNGFCAPHWRWNKEIVRALDDSGWWGAVDRDKNMPYTKKFYKYNFLLNEPFYESNLELLKLHGHIYGTKNDVGRCIDSLLRLPLDTEWVFATECLEET